MVSVNQVWKGLYSSKQRMIGALNSISIEGKDHLNNDEYVELLKHRLYSKSTQLEVKEEVLNRLLSLLKPEKNAVNLKDEEEFSNLKSELEDLKEEMAKLMLSEDKKHNLLNRSKITIDGLKKSLLEANKEIEAVKLELETKKEKLSKRDYVFATVKEDFEVLKIDNKEKYSVIERLSEELDQHENHIAKLTQENDLLKDQIENKSSVKPHFSIVIGLIAILCLQIYHLTILFTRTSVDDNFYIALFGSVAIESTAVIVTYFTEKKNLVQIFMLLQLMVGLCFYFESMPNQIVKILLSGLIAFTLYSYSELFTIKKSSK